MDQHNFGEIFQRAPRRSSRPSRSLAQYMPSYNEDAVAPDIGEGDCGDANASEFPCNDFMVAAGIREDFLFLVNNAGLTTYTNDESHQYAMLTKIFVESFDLNYGTYESTVSFKIYDWSIIIPLQEFCDILGVSKEGSTKKISHCPPDLVEVYRGVTGDDSRRVQRGKIRNIHYPAVRYFTYYLATNILGRENTSNISHYHLAVLDAALHGSTKYNLGALIARRLATKGPIYGGNIASRVLHAYNLSVHPSDTVLEPIKLDLATMIMHHFVTPNSCVENLVYRMLFADGEEREIPLPQPEFFDIHRGTVFYSKGQVDEHLRLLEFHD